MHRRIVQIVIFCLRQVLAGSDGTAGNPAEGSRGPLSRDRLRRRMPSLRIGVPPGTVVKRGAAGRLLGELVNPGEAIIPVTGGLHGPASSGSLHIGLVPQEAFGLGKQQWRWLQVAGTMWTRHELMMKRPYAGDEIVVARGGRGGEGVVAPSAQPQRRPRTGRRGVGSDVVEEIVVEDVDWKLDSCGAPGGCNVL